MLRVLLVQLVLRAQQVLTELLVLPALPVRMEQTVQMALLALRV